MIRDRSIDLSKGLAILFVYLGHSVLYHPIDMSAMYGWCNTLASFIESFNMPMFFIISGYLFSKSQKSTTELLKGKTLRILIPYLTTMTVIICMKLILPSSMSYNQAVKGGLNSLVINALCYGGDRWFVYTLYIIFLLLIPIRSLLKNKWFEVSLVVLLIVVYFLHFLPPLFALDKVFHFMVFFVVGYALCDCYQIIKTWALKCWYYIYAVFLIGNLFFINTLGVNVFVFRFVLPITGTLAVMTMAFQMEKGIEKSKVVQYIEYIGKYSLQFYLFPFTYPLIRWGIVSVLHITNPVVIVLSVFALQIITVTIIVEITRRIRFLKIPCGY